MTYYGVHFDRYVLGIIGNWAFYYCTVLQPECDSNAKCFVPTKGLRS